MRRLEASMFAYNTPIRRLLTGAGRSYRISSDELGTFNLTIDLTGTLHEGSGEPSSSASPARSARGLWVNRRTASRGQSLREANVSAGAARPNR
jgi:hypothetical protein